MWFADIWTQAMREGGVKDDSQFSWLKQLKEQSYLWEDKVATEQFRKFSTSIYKVVRSGMSIKYPNGDVKWTNGERSQVQGRGPD